uniref:Ankyrin repeat protein n=1 Tax=Mycena chlorophos TaxID=658473 RepID=A0ABQ0LYX8_MYCCL|nr:predicted protein [Mycena chlorophos]
MSLLLDLPPELHLQIAETALVDVVSRDNPPSVFLDTLQSSFIPVQDLPEQVPDLWSMSALARTCKYFHRTLNNSLYTVCAGNAYLSRVVMLFAVDNQLEGLFDRLVALGVPADAFYIQPEWLQPSEIKPHSSELVTLLYVAASKPTGHFVAKVLAAIPTASARSSLAYHQTYNNDYQTPIMLAICSGEFQSVQLLSGMAPPPDHEFASDADARRDYLSRALIATCAAGFRMLVALELLIDEGADMNFDNGEALSLSCLNDDEEMVQMLLQAGAAPVYPSITPTSPGIIHALADAGADLNEVTSDNWDLSALQRAVDERADVDIVRALLECGADIHVRNARGKTILHFACLGPVFHPPRTLAELPDYATVELLLDSGAARYITEPDLEHGGITPMAIAKRAGYTDILGLFMLFAEDEKVAQELHEYLEDRWAGRKTRRRRALLQYALSPPFCIDVPLRTKNLEALLFVLGNERALAHLTLTSSLLVEQKPPRARKPNLYDVLHFSSDPQRPIVLELRVDIASMFANIVFNFFDDRGRQPRWICCSCSSHNGESDPAARLRIPVTRIAESVAILGRVSIDIEARRQCYSSRILCSRTRLQLYVPTLPPLRPHKLYDLFGARRHTKFGPAPCLLTSTTLPALPSNFLLARRVIHLQCVEFLRLHLIISTSPPHLIPLLPHERLPTILPPLPLPTHLDLRRNPKAHNLPRSLPTSIHFVHKVPNGSCLIKSGSDLNVCALDGSLIETFENVFSASDTLASRCTSVNRGQDLGTTRAYAQLITSTTDFVQSFKFNASFVVPPESATFESQIIFLAANVELSDGSLMRAALQYDASNHQGGPFWTYTLQWEFIDGPNTILFQNPLPGNLTLQPGQRLIGFSNVGEAREGLGSSLHVGANLDSPPASVVSITLEQEAFQDSDYPAGSVVFKAINVNLTSGPPRMSWVAAPSMDIGVEVNVDGSQDAKIEIVFPDASN